MRLQSIFFCLCACIYACALPAQNDQNQAQTKLACQDNPPWMTGEDWFEQFRKDYQAGKYKTFLQKLEDYYQQERKAGRLDALIEDQQRGLAQANKIYHTSEEELHKLNQEDADIRKKELQELVQVAESQPDSPSSKTIQALQKRAERFQNAKDKSFYIVQIDYTLVEPKTPTIEKLEQISRTYWVKASLLDVAFTPGAALNAADLGITCLHGDAKERYQTALQLEKLQAMMNMAKLQEDEEVANKIQEAFSVFPVIVAEQHDNQILNQLVAKDKKPANETEKKVASILKNYQERRQKIVEKSGALRTGNP